jgi:hypothetical protein
MAWALAVFPVFWSENVIADVARAVVSGETFKADVLAAVEARTENDSNAIRRPSFLKNAAVIRLRLAEDAMRAGDPDLADQRLESLAKIVNAAFLNAPNDPFLWLVWFWLDTTRNGLRPENFRYLGMSYDLGPYEGWIAVKRNRIALAAFPALPHELGERAISEFVGLVRWGFVADAAEIAAGAGRPLRSILFPRLKDLKPDQRRVFANLIYRRDLTDVLVPGFAPPPVQIPVPVLPPGF